MEDLSVGDISIDPSLLQISLEQTQPASAPPPNRQTSGKSSPSRGRCVKEYEEQLQQLQHENFNLKLRVFLLEERMGKALGRGDAADIIKNNIELKVENETLKKSLTEKNDLLAQASSAIEELEAQQRNSQVAHQTQTQALQNQLNSVQKELDEVREMQANAAQRMSSLNLMTGSTDESVDLYAQAFGSFVLNSQQPGTLHCNYPDHHSQEELEDLNTKIVELELNVEGLRSEAAVQLMEIDRMKLEIEESQPKLLLYRQRIKELESDVSEQDARIRQLETEETEKDNKIDCLMQQLETRNHHSEIQEQESRKHTLRQDALTTAVGNGSSIFNNNNNDKQTQQQQPDGNFSVERVQEIVERDKIIEEKQYQLEQQNKILVEIQITLDEKQKQIDELESALAERKKKVEELENSLSKAGRTLQGFVADVHKKEKELELYKTDAKKKDKRIKDLTAELKEVKDMLNKAKWEAETSGREDNVKAMAEEENERLWAELEEKKRLLESAERDRNLLKMEAEKLQASLATMANKDQAIFEADRRNATLTANNEELQRQMQLKDRQLDHLSNQLTALRTAVGTPTVASIDQKPSLTTPSQSISIQDIVVPQSSSNIGVAADSSVSKQRKSRSFKESSQPSILNNCSVVSEHKSSVVSTDQAVSNTSLPTPLIVAETTLPAHGLHDAQLSAMNPSNSTLTTAYLTDLQNQLSTLRDIDRFKDNEISQLRQELSVCRKEVMDLSSKLMGETAVCRTHEASSGPDRLLINSLLPVQHSTGLVPSSCPSVEESALKSEQMALRKQMDAYIRERKELTESVDQLKKQLALLSTTDPTAVSTVALVESLRHQLEASESRGARAEIELNKLRQDFKQWKKKSTSSVDSSHCNSQDQQSHLRMYKKEVTVLRKRLADSTNACDVLRTRMEEMVDFLEEILSLGDQGLINLSNWSAKRRQTLQHSILQSRELSRSLSQSLMIGVDLDSLHDSLQDLHSTSSSVSASSWSVHGGESGRDRSCSITGSEQLNSSHENLANQQGWNASVCPSRSTQLATPTPAHSSKEVVDEFNNTRVECQESASVARVSDNQLTHCSRDLTDHQQVIDKLRTVVAHLEDQIKQRDVEIAWLNMEREKNAVACNANKAVQTDGSKTITSNVPSVTSNAIVSSTPCNPLGLAKPILGPDCSVTSSFISPIVCNSATLCEPAETSNTAQLCKADRALVSTFGGLLNLSQSMPLDDTVKTPWVNAVGPTAQSTITDAKLVQNSEKKTHYVSHSAIVASESEAWSEPDRNVSLARIGLSAMSGISQENGNFHSLSSLVSSARRPRAHSASGIVHSSSRVDAVDRFGDDSSNSDSNKLPTSSASRRSRSDAHESKKINSRLRLLEQENTSLRSQLSTVISSLRCTWNAHKVDDCNQTVDQSTYHEDTSNGLANTFLNRSPNESALMEDGPDVSGNLNAKQNSVATAQYIIDALQGRLIRMKESMKRKEQRLRDGRDLITQLEFKVKEKYFKNCENESRLREAYEKLQEKNQLVADLELRLNHLETRHAAELTGKDNLISELVRRGDNRDAEIRNYESKCRMLETSLADSQKALRQTETDYLAQHQLVVKSKTALEEQVRCLQGELETMHSERQRLQYAVENLKSKLETAEDVQRKHESLLQERDNLIICLKSASNQLICNQCQQSASAAASSNLLGTSSTATNEGRKNGDRLQRQLSHMSDYVSDQAVEEADHQRDDGNAAAVLENRRNSTRPSTLHLSPDLGIDSDPSRYSSLENRPTGAQHQQAAASHASNLVNEVSWRLVAQENGEAPNAVASSPDVLSGQMGLTSTTCNNCDLLRRKYSKAKQTLAVTLEKLQAANLRKEKVDRALNRELGKTNDVLRQARGLLEQANSSSQPSKSKP